MTMQISNLRSGTKNQLLNPKIDYSTLPSATSHIRHSGSNQTDVEQIWKKVISEHPERMKVLVKGIEIDLRANWSLSKQSVSYNGSISKEDLESKFFLKSAINKTPSISIQFGNIIVVSNGKNSFTYICPSLIEILNETLTGTNNVLGEGLFCGLPCQNCKHKNSVTVGNGWNCTRCRLQPHKDFWQIKAEDDFVRCGFHPFA